MRERGTAAPDSVSPQVNREFLLGRRSGRLRRLHCSPPYAVARTRKRLRLLFFSFLPLMILNCFTALRLNLVSK
jgi:hypothetical protein